MVWRSELAMRKIKNMTLKNKITTLKNLVKMRQMKNQMVWRSELAMRKIKNMTLKNKIATLKNLVKMRQMTLNDPKFDL